MLMPNGLEGLVGDIWDMGIPGEPDLFFITSLANKQAHGYCLTRSHFFVNDEDERFRLIVRAHPESL